MNDKPVPRRSEDPMLSLQKKLRAIEWCMKQRGLEEFGVSDDRQLKCVVESVVGKELKNSAQRVLLEKRIRSRQKKRMDS